MNYSNIRRYNKIVISLLLITLFMCASFVSSAADSGSVYDQDRISFSEEGQIGHVKMIKVPFPGVDEKVNEWKFPYSDGFFSMPSDEFSITAARGSMGLTVSAVEDLDHKYLHVRQEDNKAMMVAVGFEGTTYSNGMGSKTGSYSLADNAKALKDGETINELPYFDVILYSSGKLTAGADAG